MTGLRCPVEANEGVCVFCGGVVDEGFRVKGEQRGHCLMAKRCG